MKGKCIFLEYLSPAINFRIKKAMAQLFSNSNLIGLSCVIIIIILEGNFSIRIIIHGTKLDRPAIIFPIQNYRYNSCLSWHIRFVLTAKDNSCLEKLIVQQGNQCHAINPIFACENLKTYRAIKI